MKTYFLILTLFITLNVFGHEGVDHGEKPKTAQAGKKYFTVTSLSQTFELVLRYEPLSAGKKSTMKLFLSDFTTNAPIKNAKMEITSDEDPNLKFPAKQIESGIYSIEGSFPENKSYNLIANISAGDTVDLMLINDIQVGKTLETEDMHEDPLFTTNSILLLVAGLIGGAIISFFILRKRRTL